MASISGTSVSQSQLQRKTKKLSKRDLSRHRLEKFKREVETDLHSIPLSTLCKRLDTNPITGLTTQQAELVLERTGPNALTPASKTPTYLIFFKTLVRGFNLLLWIGALLCFIAVLMTYFTHDELDMHNVILGAVLVTVVMFTGCFTFYQEHKSSEIMETFANMVPPKATVIRDGVTQQIFSKDLVVGDLVDLKFGDRVPADVRIIESKGFKVDNACLTGESEPLLRLTECTSENLMETKNVAFFSSNAVEGLAKGIVIACGDNTVIGHVAGLTARIKPNPTPIAKELHRFMIGISIWAVSLGVIFGIIVLLMNQPLFQCALFLIGLIVANVPEGLTSTVTVSLTIAAKRMAAKNCLVKNLEAVETLGSTSMICSDKTGTLTQNRMSAYHVWFSNQSYETDLSVEQRHSYSYCNQTGFKMLMRCATLCNRAVFTDDNWVPVMKRTVRGDASEEAILKFVEISRAHEIPPAVYRNRYPKLAEIPFSSVTKYQVSIHAIENNKCLLVMKGAPERILEKCAKILINGQNLDLNDRQLKACDNACLSLAKQGERVLGFCDLELPDVFTHQYKFDVDRLNFPLKGLRFLGFISLMDPPRPQVFEAVEKCRSAGIRVIMVTGDHPATAASIAKKVGIITSDGTMNISSPKFLQSATDPTDAIVVEGSTLKNMAPPDLDNLLFTYKEIVFARTSPTQKLQIVEGCQRLVAVTGDGVNDAPALKKADIGIAMGICGTEVSQQSSDMILLDDNFASIVIGVEEGRRIFDNLKKSIVYVLASNIPEITPFLAYVIISIPLPLNVFAMLCIDILTDMLPAISLAYEQSETDIMTRPPRNPYRDYLVSARLYMLCYGMIGMIEACAGFFVYFMVMMEHGFLPSKLIGLRNDWEDENINDLEDSFGQRWTHQERMVLQDTCSTAFLVAIVVCQWADLIVCKTRRNSIFHQKMKNQFLNISLVVETVLTCLLAYLPFTYFIGMYPVHWRWWLYALPFSVLILVLDELRKMHIRKYPYGFFRRETYY